jgi:hypothetical protein
MGENHTQRFLKKEEKFGERYGSQGSRRRPASTFIRLASLNHLIRRRHLEE